MAYPHFLTVRGRMDGDIKLSVFNVRIMGFYEYKSMLEHLETIHGNALLLLAWDK